MEGILAQLDDGDSDDAYTDAQIELDTRAGAIPEPTDLPPGPFSHNDPHRAAVRWANVDENGYLNITTVDWTGDADDDADKVALLSELSTEAQAYRDATPGEIAYEQALQSISTLADTLDDQQRREYADYATRLTDAVKAKLAALELAVPLSITTAPAPEAWSNGDFDKHAPSAYPRNAIEGAIESAVMETATPAALPGSPLKRLGASRRASS